VADDCPTVPDHDQSDLDRDGVGDACEPRFAGGAGPTANLLLPAALRDQDRDGIPDPADDCPAVANHDQSDVDGDGLGDACDPDVDGDGVPNLLDDCPRLPDAAQQGACGVAAAPRMGTSKPATADEPVRPSQAAAYLALGAIGTGLLVAVVARRRR